MMVHSHSSAISVISAFLIIYPQLLFYTVSIFTNYSISFSIFVKPSMPEKSVNIPDYVLDLFLTVYPNHPKSKTFQYTDDSVRSDVFDNYSDVSSDANSNSHSVAGQANLRTVSSFLDDEPLPNYDFQESVLVNPSFLPDHEPGPRIDSPQGNGDAVDYFQLFYSDDFLENVCKLTIDNTASKQNTDTQSYRVWKPITVAELKAYYAVCQLVEKSRSYAQHMGRPCY